MKKISKIVLIVSISAFILGCTTTKGADLGTEPPVVVGTAATFNDAVQECYRMTAETLFYSSDGISPSKRNRIQGPNEIGGVCTDYEMEFIYYWNVIQRYDVVYGKAYFADGWDTYFTISDAKFVKKGTIGTRRKGKEEFKHNLNERGSYGVYRDARYIKRMYTGKLLPGLRANHGWVVIWHDNAWYNCDPSAWDTDFRNYHPSLLDIKK